ncbi:RHS repeat-associated core domain-containing protein [Pelotomaculum sp. FP]|uniref:RHS repeat-associated core domain-containing protein n=1 Tax=Pelotomaculum sp. FP TaxID=261474 RepID=UPI001065E7F8|nr:RHS repeat-associated core domain-containing protein [Pelotomaculum sp. FP]
MFCLKAKNLMVFLLASLLILSLTNASCTKYSIAAESDNGASATANEQLDTIEVEEIYQDEGVFIRHIKHVPKSKSPFPPSESNNTSFNESKAAPTVDSSNVKAIIPSVAETVYDNTAYLPLTPEDNSVMADVYGPNDLILESDTQKDRSVSREVYGEFSIKNKKGMYTAAFTPNSGSQLLRFSNGDASLLMSPLNPRSVSSSVYQNTITYENIYPDTNIRYTLESNRLKEDIIVQRYTGMSDFYFQLSVSNAVYDNNSEGEICFFDVVTAKPLFYLAKPYAMDKNGNRCDLVTLALTKEGLKLTVDQDWLKKAAYPITIDPTIYLLDATFTRASFAYKKDGTPVSANQPRYEAGKFGQAIMVEEGTTNLFNNPSVESDNSGWYIDGAERSSSAKWHGAYSVRVYGNGSSAYRRVWTPVAPISQSGTHAISFYLKGQWANVSIQAYNASGTVPSGCVGGPSSITWLTTNPTSGGNASSWTRYVAICSGWPTNTANVRVRVSACDGSANSNEVFVDAISCEAKPYVTSFTTPTRSAEAMTIPTTGIISAGQGSIEVSAYIDPSGVHSANNPNWSMVFAMADVQSSPYLEKNQISIRRRPNSTNWYIYFSNASGQISSVNLGNITAAGWYSFGVTWQAGVEGRGYLNGVNKGNVAASYLPTSITAPVYYIGSWRGDSNYFNQLIDDLRISNRVRTMTEILAAYNSALPLSVDASTTCKLTFDDNTQAGVSDTGGTGIKPYWNYTSASLGGGWSFSVNTYNLNMILNKTLFQVPGRGIPIGESITYNSQDTTSGPLGPGWHLGSAVSLVEKTDESVIYTGGDGSSYTFTPNGSGGYTAPKGIYLTLQKTGMGNFTITDKNQNVYTFLNGKPIRSVDWNNNTTTYTYDGNFRLAQSRDPSGRIITYSYNTSGRLTSVTDPANRTYQLTYQNGYLTGITDPDNQTTTLSYDTSGHLLSFRDPLNRVTSFILESNGRLQAFNDARSNGQDIYRTSFSQSTQSNRVVTTVTDPRGNASKYYHGSSTGNLVQYSDPLGNNWNYQWTDNNLITITDIKGSTTYEYDSKGNVTKTTDTVDSNPANNIVKTMTYDEYNQLLEVVDGSGRKTSYKYDNRGNLLATSNPDVKESNGRKYDQYGNVIEYSPRMSSSRNLLLNGGFEIAGTGGELLYKWTRVPGAATASLEGCQLYGNSALKLSSSTSTTDLFYQRVEDLHAYDKLTLRADVKLENVVGSRGARIKLDYPGGNEYDETYECRGTGTVPLVLTSKVPRNGSYDYVDVYIGLYGASGTVWFDGVQLENIYCTSEDYDMNNNHGFEHYGYPLSDFNLVENSSFEDTGNTRWRPNPYNTQKYFVYQPWEGIKSLGIDYGSMYQDVPVYANEPLTLSGMVKSFDVEGNGAGAYLKIDFYNSANQIITGSSAETGRLTGTQEYTRLSCLANAPAQAKYARVQLVVTDGGSAYFDTIRLVHRKTEKYTYNASGNYPATSEDASGKRSSSTYNENTGTKASFTDALNHTTSYGYDNLNRLIQVTDPLSRRAYIQYDQVGNLTATRDPRSASSTDNTYRTAYNHNNINQLNSLVDPLSANTVNTYDRAGNLTRVLLPNGLEVNYTYDSANRLTRETLSNGKYFNYSYDGANNLIRVADQDNNSYTWEYDGAGRVISSTDNFNYKLYYRWDKSNNLIDKDTKINTYDRYIYDSNNKLACIRDNSYYSYDENGRLYQKKYNCGGYDEFYRTINYYPNGWCKTIQDSGFPDRYRMNYSYYDNGNISTISSWAGEESFSYDGNGRLIQWTYTPRSGNPVQENYQYDAAGNLLTKGSATYTYNNANQITNAGFTYDNNGNMTSDRTYNYTYNAENQLIQVKRKSDNSLVATYTYNFNGLRKSKTVYSGQTATTTNFHWDAFGRLIRESNSSGEETATYSYDLSGNLLKVNGINVQSNTRGDVVSLCNSFTSLKAKYHYDPWGKQISYTGTLDKPQPFRYAGYYFDEETGLYYLKSRYYSPTLGRFLTKDSIEYIKYGNPQTLNLYTYAENNPISNIDPNGEGILSTIVSAIVEHAISKAISSLSHSSSSSSKKKKTTLLASIGVRLTRIR